jgi:hypothetical protein
MKKNLLFLFAFLILGIFACKKEKTISEPSQPLPAATNIPGTEHKVNNAFLDSFYKANEAPLQAFTLNSGTDGIIKGSNGTVIHFPPNSFLDQNDQPVTGNIEIQLKEIHSKADMILSGAYTVAANEYLISGGEIFVKATQQNNVLKLKPGANIKGYMLVDPIDPNAHADTAMRLFRAPENISRPGAWVNSFDPTQVVLPDTIPWSGGCGAGFAYLLKLGSTLGWINTDHPWKSQGAQTGFTIKTTCSNPSVDLNHTLACVSIDNYNVVGDLSRNNSSNWFENASGFTLPVGQAVTFIVISEINGQYYSCFSSVTLSQSYTATLTLLPTTKSDLKIQLEALH